MSERPVRPGRPDPLGATWDGAGVNFALFSQHATGVELCLFDASGAERRLPLDAHSDGVWHGYVPGVGPGQLYAYRVHGPHAPAEGHRFNPAKLLLDPAARAITGAVHWHDALRGDRAEAGAPDEPDSRDSAPWMPRGVVIDPAFDWGDDRPPRTPWHRSAIYECHVRGLTAAHPAVPPELRGTFAGLAHPAVLAHLQSLGITAVELLPVHHHTTERAVAARGLTNYWGYSTIGFFAPDCRFAAGEIRGDQVREFKDMVRALHAAGLEVLLDVVYNHTGEGGHEGPTLSFRGIDNASYYCLRAADRREYADVTGCGNTLQLAHPRVLQLVLDSLRYWVQEMHVDGFRFDLAPALARSPAGSTAFLQAVGQDPVLRGVKLIAEPWDLGEDGYWVGRFPPGWSEWNGRFRDCVRRFWRGDGGQLAELGSRLTGSSDLYAAAGRGPQASVNFVTAHDGFTLADLVSYESKHNAANREDNRDGSDHEHAWNCGQEGPSANPVINALRARQVRNFLATLLLSQGVPMLTAGDELGRSQGGNNNAYCQDNPISWLAWPPSEAGRRTLELTRRLLHLRQDHPVFHYPRFLRGRASDGPRDAIWLRPDGKEMAEADWGAPEGRALGLLLCGDSLEAVDERGEPIRDETFLLLLNGSAGAVTFHLPPLGAHARWMPVLDTRAWEPPAELARLAGEPYAMESRSLAVLRLDAGAAAARPAAAPGSTPHPAPHAEGGR